MHVYLVQHGKAKSAEEDPNRGLTDKGRDEVTLIAEFMCNLRISVSLIQHSGQVRAEETAHILASIVRTAAGPSYTQGLNPSDDTKEMVNFLKVYTDDILIVGHLPHLERLASVLLTGNPDLRPVRFRNSGVVCLEKEQHGTWSLVWAVLPELIQPLSRLAAD